MDKILKSFLFFGWMLTYLARKGNAFDLTIVHDNDVHSRIQEMNKYGGECNEEGALKGECFGGEARRTKIVQEIRANKPNVLLLEAGDRFTGTIWFSYYLGESSAVFMNRLQYNATSLGNHEFDRGINGLVPYLDNLTVPVVAANVDVSGEPRLMGKFTKSITVQVGGRDVGIVGYLTPKTAFISNPGPTVRFLDEVTSTQAEVDVLKGAGVDIIIALGHSGYAKDQEIAREVDGVDVVVGGHSNTFLYTGTPPSNDVPAGPYPTVITQDSGRKVLVVQDFAWAKYLGVLDVSFDSNGEVDTWSGNPVLLDNSIAQDPDTLTLVNQMAQPLEVLKRQVVGKAAVYLQGERILCRLQECNLGNLMADAMVDFHVGLRHPNNTWAPAAIALINGGGIRNPISKGDVTISNILTVLPFANTVDKITLKGMFLRQALEFSVHGYDPVEQEGKFLQFSGVKVNYDLRKPNGQRVVSVLVRCLECDVPEYSPLEDDKHYDILLSSFLANGGDGYSMFRDNRTDIELFNSLDTDVLKAYIQKSSLVYTSLEGRIVFSTSKTDCPVSAATAIKMSTTVVCLALAYTYNFIY